MSVTKQDLTVYLFPFKRCSNCVCSHQDYLLDCDQQKVAITAGKQLNHIEKKSPINTTGNRHVSKQR